MRKVLLVEDEYIIAMSISEMLSDMSLVVTGIAASGAEAISMIEVDRPDFIISDITIEGEIDGIDLAGIVHEKYRIPIIFLTGHMDERTIGRILQVPHHCVLNKPIDEQMLGETLNSI